MTYLKKMAEPLTPIMTLIFSASLKQGKTPDDWKEANVSLIFKKGDKSQQANYRPVYLTCVCSKVLEHIIHSHLMNFFEDNQILCDQQHGFRKHRSCKSQPLTTAILHLVLKTHNRSMPSYLTFQRPSIRYPIKGF